MEIKKYLAVVFSASLLIGLQVKAEEVKPVDITEEIVFDEDVTAVVAEVAPILEDAIKEMVEEVAAAEGITPESWIKKNDKIIKISAAMAGVIAAVAGVYAGYKYSKKDKKENVPVVDEKQVDKDANDIVDDEASGDESTEQK